MPQVDIHKFLQKQLLFACLLELTDQDTLNLLDQSSIQGRLLYHELKWASVFFSFQLSAVSQAIFCEALAMDDLFIMIANGIDVTVDGSHEETDKGRTVRLPIYRSIFLNSSHASNPRLFILILEFADAVNELLKTFHHHFYLGFLQHAIC